MIAIVTGAAQGLGAAFAAALREAGYTVVTCDVKPGCDAVVDVADAAAVKAWIDDIVARHGRIDVAVANAGVARMTTPLDPWEQGLDDFKVLIGTNLAGVFHVGRAVAPVMVAQGRGDIVVISTDHVAPPPGRRTGGGSRMDAYDASKWGLRGLVEAWALSLGKNGVRVNALCMGATDTAMVRGFLGDRITDEIVAEWMRPEEVAQVMMELIGEGADGRTGEHIGLWVGHPVELPPREGS